MEVLLIEDDKRISDFLVKGLTENHFSVTLAESAEEARDLVDDRKWNILLLDIMLPGMDGVEFTKMLRYKKNDTPILILSALSGIDDKINLLDSGADDYLVKPFHFSELLSRINALVRRHQQKYSNQPNLTEFAYITIDKDTYSVFVDKKEVDLSPTEFKLLSLLIENKNKVLSRTRILDSIWDINYQNNTNIVDVYISYLRSKIEKPNGKLIHTVKGVGYMIKEE